MVAIRVCRIAIVLIQLHTSVSPRVLECFENKAMSIQPQQPWQCLVPGIRMKKNMKIIFKW